MVSPLFTPSLVPDADCEPPVGLVIGRVAARPLLAKLHERLSQYASLRMVMTEQFVVLLSPERKPLPWSADVSFFLRRAGAAIVPSGMRLDVPARWHDDIVARLAAVKRQAPPLLILPNGAESGLMVMGLGEACSLENVDLLQLADGDVP